MLATALAHRRNLCVALERVEFIGIGAGHGVCGQLGLAFDFPNGISSASSFATGFIVAGILYARQAVF